MVFCHLRSKLKVLCVTQGKSLEDISTHFHISCISGQLSFHNLRPESWVLKEFKCIFRSLDNAEQLDPEDGVSEFEQTIRNIEKLRPSLTREQNVALDKKIWDQISSSPIFRVKDDDGNEVYLLDLDLTCSLPSFFFRIEIYFALKPSPIFYTSEIVIFLARLW